MCSLPPVHFSLHNITYVYLPESSLVLLVVLIHQRYKSWWFPTGALGSTRGSHRHQLESTLLPGAPIRVWRLQRTPSSQNPRYQLHLSLSGPRLRSLENALRRLTSPITIETSYPPAFSRHVLILRHTEFPTTH